MQVFSYEFCVTFKIFFLQKTYGGWFWCKNLPKKPPKNKKNPWNIQISIVFCVFIDAEHNC